MNLYLLYINDILYISLNSRYKCVAHYNLNPNMSDELIKIFDKIDNEKLYIYSEFLPLLYSKCPITLYDELDKAQLN